MSAPLPFSSVFTAPDDGPSKEAYTCSFHWFRATDGRIIGMDVVRSEDKHKLALRVFACERDGTLRALLHEAPLPSWAPFEVAARQSVSTRAAGRDVMGRGENWVAGSVAAAADPRGIKSTSFDLQLTVEKPGLGPGSLIRPAVRMSVLDYPMIRYHGFVTIDDERLTIDSLGSASVHFGQRLVEYVFLASVPEQAHPDAPQILLAAAKQDDVAVPVSLLGDSSVIYAYGRGGVPPVMLHAATLDSPNIPIGLGTTIELSDASIITHQLLDEPTWTASVQATLVRPAPALDDVTRHERIELGRVMIDCRGAAQSRVMPGGRL